VTDQPRRYTFDRQGRVQQPKPAKATSAKAAPKPKRRPQARELLTEASERILDGRYAGQVRAVVIERALKRMDEADERLEQAAARRGRRP
jgi:hypothetical protein